jgi:hypothetical protein
MNYLILHNDCPVCTVDIDEDYRIESIQKVHDRNRLPIGIREAEKIRAADLDAWLFSRAIPEKREGLELILESNNVESNRELLIRNLGLGLSDHYWIRAESSGYTWKEVNFFENNFGGEGDDIFIGDYKGKLSGERTPNGVSSGMLPKKWIIQGDERHLMKGSDDVYRQEPFNEKTASCFLDKLSVDHVKYELIWYKKTAYSLCKNMLGTENELISAYYIQKIKMRDKGISYYEHYIGCCTTLGLSEDIRSELEKMIVVDYIIGNTDRHWSNFGIIRDANTLKAERLAPLYDNGASFFTKIHHMAIPSKNRFLTCQSFKRQQNDNIKLVRDFSWIQKEAVKELPDLVEQTLSRNKFVDNDRRSAIAHGIRERIQMMERHMSRNKGLGNHGYEMGY